jgi:hypothetical protein
VTDLVVDDLLFVALAADGGPALTAEDLSAFIQVTP